MQEDNLYGEWSEAVFQETGALPVKVPNPICFYHKSDLDGKCSAAIVKRHVPDCELYRIQYGDEFPWDKINPNRTVYMVDFSLPEHDMVKLACVYAGERHNNFIWIDHHKTAIEMNIQLELCIKGARFVHKAACELTWYWFNPGTEIPRAVYLLGRYDVWDHSDDDVLPFQYGMRAYDNAPTAPVWCDLLISKLSHSYISYIIREGRVIMRYTEHQNAQVCEQCAFHVKFDGYDGIAMNLPFANSQAFKSAYDPDVHDMMIPFYYDGDKWIVSLYTERDDLDVSIIAKKRGGGGHKKAAGFTCQELPEELR